MSKATCQLLGSRGFVCCRYDLQLHRSITPASVPVCSKEEVSCHCVQAQLLLQVGVYERPCGCVCPVREADELCRPWQLCTHLQHT